MRLGDILLFASIMLLASNGTAQQASASDSGKLAFHFATIDYDTLYKMPQPPVYKAFSYYGEFLFSVAKQQTRLAVNIARPTPDNVTQTLDIKFKEIDGIELSLDIFEPKGDTSPNPLIVITHGGAWEAGDKAAYRSYGLDFAALGYTVASINYRLSGQAAFPAAIEDTRDAIAFLRKNAAKYKIDPDRLVMFGSSAGGHLAAFTGLAANTPKVPYLKGVDGKTVKAIISIFGPHDLTLDAHRNHRVTRLFLGKTFKQAPDLYREASPINHVDKNDPPVLLIHGSLDAIVPSKNSDLLAEKLKSAGVPVNYDKIEGWSHVMDFFSPIAERTLWQCYHFLKKYAPSDELLKVK